MPQLELEQVAGAYANALVEVAQKTSSLEAVHADVDTLASVLKVCSRSVSMLPFACHYCKQRCCTAAAARQCAAGGRRPQQLAAACYHMWRGLSPPSSACAVALLLPSVWRAVPPITQLQPPTFVCARRHAVPTCRPCFCNLLPQDNDSLKDLLSNPVIAEAKKKEVVKRLAAEASFSQVRSAPSCSAVPSDVRSARSWVAEGRLLQPGLLALASLCWLDSGHGSGLSGGSSIPALLTQ